jgi:hypothetical protein
MPRQALVSPCTPWSGTFLPHSQQAAVSAAGNFAAMYFVAQIAF